ncbi:MAG TPA: hypothetical protein VGI79_03430 [Caulobacteraceae bacterium]|jgi:hypothetical protein
MQVEAQNAVDAHRLARAERLNDYFELQLLFAERLADLASLSLPEAVARYTNFHKRFGLGAVEDGPPSETWLRYAEPLDRLGSTARRLAWTKAFFAGLPEERPPTNRKSFGCFSSDPPDDAGVVRIHFLNKDAPDDPGPLSRAKMPDRRRELMSMFAFIRQAHPSAMQVRGGSWLYNLEAYRRLFPPEYGRSRTPMVGPRRLNGSSSWGQFLDRREAVKPDRRRAFLQNFVDLDAAAPWLAFPIQPLITNAPVALFYAFYEIGA